MWFSLVMHNFLFGSVKIISLGSISISIALEVSKGSKILCKNFPPELLLFALIINPSEPSFKVINFTRV